MLAKPLIVFVVLNSLKRRCLGSTLVVFAVSLQDVGEL